MILFQKAIIRGGAAGDLFAVPVLVDGYTRKDGTYVPPHASVRHKAPEQHRPAAEPAAPPPPPPLPPGSTPAPPEPETPGADTFTIIPIQDPPASPKPTEDGATAERMRRFLTSASGERGAPDNAMSRQILDAQKQGWVEQREAFTTGGNRASRYLITDAGRAELARLNAPILEADQATYERMLYDAAMERLKNGGAFAIGTSTRTITFSDPKHAAGLRYHNGRLQLGQGGTWVNIGPIGQAIDSLANSLRMPTSWDRTAAQAEADAANPEAKQARLASASAEMEPLFAERERIRAMPDSHERDRLRKDIDRRLFAAARQRDVFLRDVEDWRDEQSQVADETADNSGSVAQGPTTPADAATFERFGDAANAFGGEPFSAQDLADRWHGHYADDALDQLHARPDEFALLTDGRWQRMDAYLAHHDRAGELTRLADAIAADHPEQHRARWRDQLRRHADQMAAQPAGRPPSPAPEPDDDLDPSSPNYRYRDTGYIAGSRKEMAAESIRAAARSGRRVRATDVDWSELEQNPREAATLITKANIFGDVDWQAMRDIGVDPGAGFLLSRIYASVGAAPAEENAQGRQDYAVAIDSLRDRLEQCRTVADVADTLQAIRDERDGVTLTAEEAHAYGLLTTAYREEADHVRGIEGQAEQLHRQAAAAETQAGALRWELEKRRKRKWKVDPADEAELAIREASAQSLRKLHTDFRAEHGMNPITTTTKDERGSSIRFQYPVREKLEKIGRLRRGFMEGVIARNRVENSMTRAWHALGPGFKAVLDYRTSKGSDAFAKHMATAKAGRIRDWDWAEKKREVKGANRQGTRFQLLVADVHERIGGRPVPADSTSALKGAFGLRDVQSGHWVLEDPNSAKFHVEGAAAALSDLADLLGVPDTHLAMKGRLGLAFGARGQGSRTGVAHYDPTHRVINMTKMAGGGSLAHEWFHFLDNIVTEAATGQPAGSDDYATEGGAGRLPAHLEAPVRKLVSAMMDGAHRATESMSYTAPDARWAEHNLDPMRGGRVRSVIRNAATMQEAVDAVDQMHAAGAFGAVGKPKTKRAHGDWRKLALIWHAEKERRAAGAGEDVPRVATFARGRGMSAFLRDAVELDEGTSGKYWSQPKELAARAFSAWAEDKLEAIGRRNTYLVALANNAPYRPFGQRPFPEGEERARIVAAFDEFLATLRADGTLAKALAALAA